MKSQLDKEEIESYLKGRLEAASREYKQEKNLTLLCTKLVEHINGDLPRTCPSVEGYKYVVHATVQVGCSGII